MADLTGFREAELRGSPLAMLLSDRDYAAAERLLTAAFKKDGVKNLRTNISTKDGGRAPVAVSASVIRGPQEEPFILLTVKDIRPELSTISAMMTENAGLLKRIDYLE